MKKITAVIIVMLSCMAVAFTQKIHCREIQVGDVYIINKDSFVPIFNSASREFEYEIGFHGNNCYALMSVLLPNFYVKINEICDQDIYKITAVPSNSYTIEGFIHKKFIVNDMTFVGRSDLKELKFTNAIPSVKEISDKLREISKSGVQYCYGCNSLDEIKLSELYTFRQLDDIGNRTRRYICQGFDSSCLLHYISNGYLPPNSCDLANFGKKLFVIDHNRPLPQNMLKEIMRELKDSDFVIFAPKSRDDYKLHGHVIISYRFGFIESRGQNYGIVVTPPYDAESRLLQMYNRAKENGVDLYIIRWHPSLIKIAK